MGHTSSGASRTEVSPPRSAHGWPRSSSTPAAFRRCSGRSHDRGVAMGQLDGRVAFITGGARGQGRAHALALAAEGADVVITDIAADPPELGYPLASADQLAETVKLVEEYGVRALGLQVDAREADQLDDAVARSVAELGGVDILCANPGVIDFSKVEATSDALWHTIIETNLTGVFKAIRAVIPQMRHQRFGRIGPTTSARASNPPP